MATEANPVLGERLAAAQATGSPTTPSRPDVAYQLIHDELLLDGSARLNLATFVTTWMEPQARVLMAECVDKNMIDKDEYPQTAELERRCVAMLADLWHAPTPEAATGCSTTGSSEACMLAGLALQRRWAARVNDRAPTAEPRHGRQRPGLLGEVLPLLGRRAADGADERRSLPPGRRATPWPSATRTRSASSAVLGSTFDGSYEPVAEIAAALDELAAGGGPDVPIHVDGASGAMIAPFLDPELVWDFRLPRVASINTSGHKYGLVYPGVGWVLWRDAAALPQELIFNVNYLGGNMPTFALNFSRPGRRGRRAVLHVLPAGPVRLTAVQQAARDIAHVRRRADRGHAASSGCCPRATSCRSSRSRPPTR